MHVLAHLVFVIGVVLTELEVHHNGFVALHHDTVRSMDFQRSVLSVQNVALVIELPLTGEPFLRLRVLQGPIGELAYLRLVLVRFDDAFHAQTGDGRWHILRGAEHGEEVVHHLTLADVFLASVFLALDEAGRSVRLLELDVRLDALHLYLYAFRLEFQLVGRFLACLRSSRRTYFAQLIGAIVHALQGLARGLPDGFRQEFAHGVLRLVLAPYHHVALRAGKGHIEQIQVVHPELEFFLAIVLLIDGLVHARAIVDGQKLKVVEGCLFRRAPDVR